jgi:hypothetical protein
MPNIPKPPGANERLCWECVHYKLHIPNGPYCAGHKKYFPNPYGWAHGKGTMCGLRTCKKWTLKIIDIEAEIEKCRNQLK